MGMPDIKRRSIRKKRLNMLLLLCIWTIIPKEMGIANRTERAAVTKEPATIGNTPYFPSDGAHSLAMAMGRKPVFET